jgi:nitroreductase
MSNNPTQYVDDAITSRQSVRRYTDEPVSRDDLYQILNVARYAPSGTNTQPWNVYAVTGAVKDAMSAAIHADFDVGGHRKSHDYDYYPTDWFEPYLARRRACGWGLYGALGITREDKALMHEQTGRNYTFFGAPAGLIFTINRRLNIGSWLDLGMFMQNVMIAARGRGLHTCAQASFANYPAIIREHITIADDEMVVCGMAVGYGDMEVPENVWRTEREPVEGFTQFMGFDE